MRLMCVLFIVLLVSQSLFAQSAKKGEPLVAAKEISKLLIFNPISELELVGKNVEQWQSDSISKLSEKLWLETIYNHQSSLPEFELFDKEQLPDIDKYKSDLEWLVSSANSNRDLKDLRISPSLHLIMEEVDCRYAMLTYLSGFRVKSGKFIGDMFKSIGLGIITLGSYAPIPYNYQSNVYVLIMDRESGHAVFYKMSEIPDGNPLGKGTLKAQFKFIFKKYFVGNL